MINKKVIQHSTKTKKSGFKVVPKEDMEFFGKMIMLKQVSYQKLLEKIKISYPEIEAERPESLRYYMIKYHFVHNQKSLDTINSNIEKSKLVQQKQKNILNQLIDKLSTDKEFVTKLFDSPLVQEKILSIVNKE